MVRLEWEVQVRFGRRVRQVLAGNVRLDSIAVSVFVFILIDFDKYNQKQIHKEI